MSVPSPVPPRPAASLLLLRDRAGLEVLMGRRGPHLRAFPGATVFPGGKIDPQDRAWPDAGGDPVRPAAYAALREVFEETGVFLAADGSGPPAGADVAQARAAVEAGRVSLHALCERWRCPVDPARLTLFQHSVTPEDAPYRFDTLFFIAEASLQEAQARLIPAEIEDLAWVEPEAVLANAGTLLAAPTRAALRRLLPFRTAGEAVSAAQPRMAR